MKLYVVHSWRGWGEDGMGTDSIWDSLEEAIKEAEKYGFRRDKQLDLSWGNDRDGVCIEEYTLNKTSGR